MGDTGAITGGRHTVITDDITQPIVPFKSTLHRHTSLDYMESFPQSDGLSPHTNRTPNDNQEAKMAVGVRIHRDNVRDHNYALYTNLHLS
jgi:hypothetical protein